MRGEADRSCRMVTVVVVVVVVVDDVVVVVIIIIFIIVVVAVLNILSMLQVLEQRPFLFFLPQAQRDYYNRFVDPMNLAKDLEGAATLEGFHLDVDLHGAVAGATRGEVHRFARELFGGGCFLQGLAQGNLTLTEAEVKLN